MREIVFFDETPPRRNFTRKTKQIEWMSAAGKSAEKSLLRYLTTGKIGKLPPSKCRKCGTKLTWGDRSYEFDHKDNNPRNNSQKNCYLVCRTCHGKATKVEKRAERDIFGNILGYKTIKRKISYKKPKSTKTKKKAIRTTTKKVASKAKRNKH